MFPASANAAVPFGCSDLGPHGALRVQGRRAAGRHGACFRRGCLGQRQVGAGRAAPREGDGTGGRVPAVLRLVHDGSVFLPSVLAFLHPVVKANTESY